MEVEFERLGPGQVGRWAYQVLGSKGPVSNPAGIRYMSTPPSGAEAAMGGFVTPGLSGAQALMSYAQLANLGLGVANLVVGVATLHQVRQLRTEVHRVQLGIDKIDAKMDRLQQTADRIDVNVAQVHLREVLRKRLQECSSLEVGYVDLEILAAVQPDILEFLKSVDGYCSGGALGLRLSSDVREMLHAVFALFSAANSTALAAHNLRVGGDPGKVTFSVDVTYASACQEAGLVLSLQRWFERTASAVGEHMHIDFMFGDRNRERAVVLKHEPGMLSILEQWDSQALVLAREAGRYVQGTSESSLKHWQEVVEQYWDAWLFSDAGLLMQLLRQLDYWSDLDGWELLDGWARELPDGRSGVLAPLATPQELSDLLRPVGGGTM